MGSSRCAATQSVLASVSGCAYAFAVSTSFAAAIDALLGYGSGAFRDPRYSPLGDLNRQSRQSYPRTSIWYAGLAGGTMAATDAGHTWRFTAAARSERCTVQRPRHSGYCYGAYGEMPV